MNWLSDILQDFGFAARTFAKRPGFAAVAVFTLALGIAAATTVFSIVEAVLLRPLPYHDPGRLAAIWLTSTREKSLAKIFATYADFVEFRRHSRTLENVAAATWATRTGRVLTGFGPAREILTIPATAEFFNTLGVTAAIGRTFTATDEGNGCSILLAHNFRTSIGADPSIVGKNLTLDQKPCAVLGIMPQRFSFYPAPTQAWILLGPDYQPDRDKMLAGIFTRLKPGVTVAQAQAELRGLYRAIHTQGETREFAPVVYDLHGEFTFLAGRTLRTTLMLVFGAVVLVLLIACLNVANLLLARLSDRRRELAVRAALGSGQGRLVRQVLTEGLLLATLGGSCGMALAYAAIHFFRRVNPIELTAGADVSVNLAVLGFSLVLSIATTLIFALLPALQASRVDLTLDLKTAGRGFVAGRQGLAKMLIALEMALSSMLLIGAVLLLASALRMGSEHLGFEPGNVVTTSVSLPSFHYSTDTQRTHAYDRLLERLQQIPAAMDIALASNVPPQGGGNQVLEVQGRPLAVDDEIHDVGADAVSPQFFDVLNVVLRRGREFDARDRENSQPVAVINEALSREYFRHADPLGRQVRIAGESMPWLTIVGVVGNLKHTQLMNEMNWIEWPILYRPLAQEPPSSIRIVMRGTGGAGSLTREIPEQIAAVDTTIPRGRARPLRHWRYASLDGRAAWRSVATCRAAHIRVWRAPSHGSTDARSVSVGRARGGHARGRGSRNRNLFSACFKPRASQFVVWGSNRRSARACGCVNDAACGG